MTFPRKNQTEYIREAIENDDVELLCDHLSVRQRRFAEEYVIDFNATAAYLRAGYKSKYPDKQAHLLTKHPGIRAYIDMLTRSKEAKIVSVDPDYIVAKIVSVINKDGTKDADVLRGLDMLARHKGMYVDRQEISGPDGGAIELQQKAQEEANALIATLRRMGKRPDLKVVND